MYIIVALKLKPFALCSFPCLWVRKQWCFFHDCSFLANNSGRRAGMYSSAYIYCLQVLLCVD